MGFGIESRALNLLARMVPGAYPVIPVARKDVDVVIRRELFALLKRDAGGIRRGEYPLSVLAPESPLEHLKRIPKILGDGLRISLRRKRGRTTEFDRSAREFLKDLPRYYRRNFHFQTNGYLSESSAELYEHQVEILFGGAADAMRRLIISELKKAFPKPDGAGLKFLEIGAGTGRATRFVAMAFPRAKITAVDLSAPYLKAAQRKLQDRPRIDFVQADGAELPFLDEQFDAVYSVFLFHELPLGARLDILRESHRVLKPRGFLGFVDSMQLGDRPDLPELDESLHEFPKTYHEPFYRNYIENPMEALLGQEGFTRVETDFGFLSKVCSSQRMPRNPSPRTREKRE